MPENFGFGRGGVACKDTLLLLALHIEVSSLPSSLYLPSSSSHSVTIVSFLLFFCNLSDYQHLFLT